MTTPSGGAEVHKAIEFGLACPSANGEMEDDFVVTSGNGDEEERDSGR